MSENLLITLGIQDKGTKAQITALNKELRTLDKELKLADKTSCLLYTSPSPRD